MGCEVKRKDLTEGVEYACYTHPTREGTWHWRTNTPFKATLVSLNYSEQRLVPGSWRDPVARMRTVSGIAVDIGKPIEYEVDVAVKNKDGTPKYTKDRYYGRRAVTRKKKVSYPYLILENGGCFRSTWADYEAEVAAKKAADKRRAEEREATIQAETEAEKTVVARVNLARKHLKAAFGKESKYGPEWSDKIEYHYGGGGVYDSSITLTVTRGRDSRKIVGFGVKMSGENLLDLLELELARGASL